MNDQLFFDCGPADNLGRRLVIGRSGDAEYRDHLQTDNAYQRRCFAEGMLSRFGWAITPELRVEIDNKLVQLADRKDVAQDERTALAVDTVRAADVPVSDVEWLWPGRIALGKVTLLAGDPGVGKSFVTLDIAARVSRGAAWPDEEIGHAVPLVAGDWPDGPAAQRPAATNQPGSVLLLSAEDDPSDTICPRLKAHGADVDRVRFIQHVASARDKHARRQLDLSRDVELLATTLRGIPDCRLLVIDPISAYLGRAAENANAEVRGVLGPLAELAATHNLAVLAVTHLRKEEGAAMYRTMGSLAFVAAARTVWIVHKDPFDSRRRLMVPVKNNLADDTAGLAYTIEPHPESGQPMVAWCPEPIRTSADEALRQPPANSPGRPDLERREATAWLEAQLAAGPQPTAEVREAAQAHGFSAATISRAFQQLRGIATRIPGTKAWQWQLPEAA